MKKTKNEMREWWERVVRVLVVGVMLFSAGVQAGYRSVDISDIQGEQRKALGDLWADLKKMPPEARDGFICEQLGLMFSKDYSRVLSTMDGHPATTNTKNAYFVGREGEPLHWWEATNAAHEGWSKCYDAAKQFKVGASLVPFKKEVRKVTRNTAKYLLKNMPEEQRWMILALMGEMAYNDRGFFDRKREDTLWGMENGINVRVPVWEGEGYMFSDPEGKEYDIRELLQSQKVNLWRWRQVIWRCENLVGAKDILALFPAEVKAMRKHSKERIAKVKDEAKARDDALLVAADETMSSLPREKRLARIALVMGLYYLDHRSSGYADGYLNPQTTIILPDGTKHSGREFVGETPGLLQQIHHEAILGYYRQPIEQMARALAKERFKEMPPMLRDLVRAQLSRKLIKLDGSPARIEESISTVQTFDRTWQVPMDAVDYQHTYSKNSGGQSIPYSLYDTYKLEYLQTFKLVNLCARILGKEETVKLIPSGDDAALTAEQQRAWLAEKMGFCFTEDGEAAYQSERTANRNAVYVDARGKVRKLSEVSGKALVGWTETTKTALAVGYDEFMAPYKEELKQLAVQTSKHILASMPSELRQSRLAEGNRFFFAPNAQVLYSQGERTLESGVRFSFLGVINYGQYLYYDSSGKIVPTTAVEKIWENRWWLQMYCETVAGIEAIDESISEEVEAMRAAFQKSPFYKK